MKTVGKERISLFGRFHNPKHLEDYVDSISRDKQNKAEIYLLLGMFEQTVKEGWKDKEK